MSRKKNDEPVRRSLSVEPGMKPESPGTFAEGRRVTTPSGAFVPRHRPLSSLAARIRGVSVGALEDEQQEYSPSVVSFGGVRGLHSFSASRGRSVVTPFVDGLSRSMATRSREVIIAPNLRELRSWLHNMHVLLGTDNKNATMQDRRSKGHPSSASLKLASNAASFLNEAYFEGSRMLQQQWRTGWLTRSVPLPSLPSFMCGIENAAQASQVDRAATLLYSLLRYKAKIESGDPQPIQSGKELRHMEPLRTTFSHSIVQDDKGHDHIAYHENSRHIIVTYGPAMFVFEVIEPESGRLLVASEIAERLKTIVANANVSTLADGTPMLEEQQAMSLPYGKLSLLDRSEYRRVRKELIETCEHNRYCLEKLDSAIMVLSLGTDASVTSEDPFLVDASDSSSYWAGKSLQVSVAPNGNAIARFLGLLCDGQVAMNVSAWVANSANCDPMLAPPVQEERTISAIQRRSKTPTTPSGGGKKPPKAAKNAPVESVEDLIAPVTVTVPQAKPCAEPKKVPLWMPVSYAANFATEFPEGERLTTFEVCLHKEKALHLAVMCAVKMMRLSSATGSAASPVVHECEFTGVRDPAVYSLMTPETEIAMRFVQQFSAKAGVLRTEVDTAVNAAISSMSGSGIVTSDPSVAHVSTVRALYSASCLQMPFHTRDVVPGAASGQAAVTVCRHPFSDKLQFTACTNIVGEQWSEFFLSYTAIPAHRSSLHRQLGSILCCSLVYPARLAEEAAELKRLIVMYGKFINESWTRHDKQRKPPRAPPACYNL